MSFDLDHYFPERVNVSPWLAAHTLNHLLQLPADRELILPICSLGTRFEELAELGSFVGVDGALELARVAEVCSHTSSLSK